MTVKTGYHVSNTNIKSVDASKLATGTFWVCDSLEHLLNADNAYCGAGLYPKKDIYVHRVVYDSKRVGGWSEYDKYCTHQLLSMGIDSLSLDGDSVILDIDIIDSIECIDVIKL